MYPWHVMITPSSNSSLSSSPPALTSSYSSSLSSKSMDEKFFLWTQEFVGKESYLNPILLDTFLANQTFQNNVELYPDKLRNLQGKLVKVSAIVYVPYVISKFVVSQSFYTSFLVIVIYLSRYGTYNKTYLSVYYTYSFFYESFRNQAKGTSTEFMVVSRM